MEKCFNPCICCKKKMASTSITENGTNVIIAATLDGSLLFQNKYCLIVAQPVPEAGKHLPVNVVVTADNGEFTAPLKKLFDKCECGVCDLEFGFELPKCRNRIPLYFTNGNDFIDLRCEEKRFYCR